jgi:hypothetical protein
MGVSWNDHMTDQQWQTELVANLAHTDWEVLW